MRPMGYRSAGIFLRRWGQLCFIPYLRRRQKETLMSGASTASILQVSS